MFVIVLLINNRLRIVNNRSLQISPNAKCKFYRRAQNFISIFLETVFLNLHDSACMPTICSSTVSKLVPKLFSNNRALKPIPFPFQQEMKHISFHIYCYNVLSFQTFTTNQSSTPYISVTEPKHPQKHVALKNFQAFYSFTWPSSDVKQRKQALSKLVILSLHHLISLERTIND